MKIINCESQNSLYGLGSYFLELKNLYDINKLPNKILLSGNKGTGKCTLAYHFINYIFSINEKFSYNIKDFEINTNNRSFKLIQNKSHPNFFLIDVYKDKKVIDIDQIRNLIIYSSKQSFNNTPRFVLIDNIELMNIHSINALLKILEEPFDNMNFILINNNKVLLKTLTSRCINFKISISFKKSIETINSIIDGDIYELVNPNLIYHYTTPGDLFDLINFSKNNDIDLKNVSLEKLLKIMINKNFYKKDNFIKKLIYNLIELFFYKLMLENDYKKNIINSYYYFANKIYNCNKFNLDEENLFLEFKTALLNE